MRKSKVLTLRGRSDEEKVAQLRKMASKPWRGRYKRHVCMQVSSEQVLRQMQSQDLGYGIAERFEVHPYTFEELWAQKMFVSLPMRRVVAAPLDWKPVTYDSRRRVHLVVFGMNAMTEALVRQACLVCHYPNYVRDRRLKTRITIVDPELKEYDNLIVVRYGKLMDFCDWSFVDKYGCESVHKPDCEYLGGDFTDVEFQFVAAEYQSAIVRVMMAETVRNENELVTVVMDDEDGEKNWDLATGLPMEYYVEGCDIPIYARMKSARMLGSATMMPQYRNIKAFGMDDCEFDLSLPLTQMAMGVSYVYSKCAETGKARCGMVDRRRAVELWNKEKAVNRFSSEALAMTIVTKLRSIGEGEHIASTGGSDDLIRREFTEEEIVLMAEIEHNRWSIERLLNGVRPVTPDEQRTIDEDRSLKKKMRDNGAHYDLRPYSALREDSTGNNVQLYDEALVRGLQPIVDAFEDHDSGPEMIVVQREIPERHPKWKSRVKWIALALLAVVAGVAVYCFVREERMNVYAKEEIGQYVYQLSVDSIEVWNGSAGIEAVLHRNCANKVVGSAFSVEGLGIVTARHCVEYWLYDSVHNVNDNTKWEDDMRMAAAVETYNDTTKGEKKRMVAICSLTDNEGNVYMERVVFDVDQSCDKVRKIGDDGTKWRYVVPIFEGDRDMLESDIAVFRRPGEKGIRLYEDLSEVKGKSCFLGYPKNEAENRSLKSGSAVDSEVDAPFVELESGADKGYSGGPVVTWSIFGGFRVFGVMSHNDPHRENACWAVLINIDK